jgi:hypothetical protein
VHGKHSRPCTMSTSTAPKGEIQVQGHHH